MYKLTVVGSGILGLSVAEFFSRSLYLGSDIQIISDNNPYSGSYAAAANLATKGQIFGRDKHFQIKIDSKSIYKSWLNDLLEELNYPIALSSFFKFGLGMDYFYSEDCRDKHFLRVKQSEKELKNLNLSLDSIAKIEQRNLIYKDEAWINAEVLLDLLWSVLKKRNVNFVKASFSNKEFEKLKSTKDTNIVIFCTGAWTDDLLLDLGVAIPEKMKKKRLTIGSTFYGKNIFENYNEDYVLTEKISSTMKNKVTLSGNNNCHFISSSTLKIKDFSEKYEDKLNEKNLQLIELCSYMQECEPVLKEKVSFSIGNLHKKTGLRVGYGHSEIIIEKLNLKSIPLSGFICAGAHKSGFLFAPKVGEMLKNIMG